MERIYGLVGRLMEEGNGEGEGGEGKGVRAVLRGCYERCE